METDRKNEAPGARALPFAMTPTMAGRPTVIGRYEGLSRHGVLPVLLRHRLSGDRNPLHIDPAAAKRGGFDRPILHGLCTYGIATRSLVMGPLNGDVVRLKEFKARFSSSVYPGDTLTTEGWKTDGVTVCQPKQRAADAICQGGHVLFPSQTA